MANKITRLRDRCTTKPKSRANCDFRARDMRVIVNLEDGTVRSRTCRSDLDTEEAEIQENRAKERLKLNTLMTRNRAPLDLYIKPH